MRDQLLTAWRGRRALLVCGTGRPGLFMQALLTQLGARPARIAPGADAAQLNIAMTQGRIGAVIVPEAHALCPGGSLTDQLGALLTLLGEVREAGVPLVILCSDAEVYRARERPWAAQENDPIGGESQSGLIQSILQLAADGVSRGLLGDAVSVIIARHPPCLGCGHPAVSAYTRWCTQLDAGEMLTVTDPTAAGVFLHPLDMCCGALALGARHLLGDRRMTGAFNLGVDPHNVMANRTAALRFIRENGGSRPICEDDGHHPASPVLPDGAKARFLCGVRPLIPADEALSMLLELERAAHESAGREMLAVQEQAQRYLEHIQ